MLELLLQDMEAAGSTLLDLPSMVSKAVAGQRNSAKSSSVEEASCPEDSLLQTPRRHSIYSKVTTCMGGGPSQKCPRPRICTLNVKLGIGLESSDSFTNVPLGGLQQKLTHRLQGWPTVILAIALHGITRSHKLSKAKKCRPPSHKPSARPGRIQNYAWTPASPSTSQSTLPALPQ